jgi:hypothetical protein
VFGFGLHIRRLLQSLNKYSLESFQATEHGRRFPFPSLPSLPVYLFFWLWPSNCSNTISVVWKILNRWIQQVWNKLNRPHSADINGTGMFSPLADLKARRRKLRRLGLLGWHDWSLDSRFVYTAIWLLLIFFSFLSLLTALWRLSDRPVPQESFELKGNHSASIAVTRDGLRGCFRYRCSPETQSLYQHYHFAAVV